MKKLKARTKTSKKWKQNWSPPNESCTHDSGLCCVCCNPLVFEPTVEEGVRYSTEALTLKIRQAKKAYYDGKPIMRDEQYDALEATLRAINPDAKVLKAVGSN